MSLTEHLQTAVERTLEESNREIVAFNTIYSDAKEFLKNFGDARLREYEAMVEPSVLDVIKEAAELKRSQIDESLKGKSLGVELILNSRDNLQLFLPVRHSGATLLERDILDHASSVMLAIDEDASTGRLGDYTAMSGKMKNTFRLRTELAKIPEAMKSVKVGLNLNGISVPLRGTYGGTNSVVIKMTQSGIRYALIPVHKVNREFFPKIKRKFELETPCGVVQAHVTSHTDIPGVGNYVMGGLRRVFDKMNLQPTQHIEISELEPKRKYSMRRMPTNLVHR